MATPRWQPATLYAPGAAVQALGEAAVGARPIPNPNFEDGTDHWDFGGTAILSETGGYTGARCVRVSAAGEANDGYVVMHDGVLIAPGQTVSLTAYGRIQAGTDGTSFSVALRFYDNAGVLISEHVGPQQSKKFVGTNWARATTGFTAPAGSRYVRAVGYLNTSASGTTSTILMDAFTWNLTDSGTTGGLIFKAVQPNLGLSGSTEPLWPTTNGIQVVDNEVTWESYYATRVEWTAHPGLVSGPVEPTWPNARGGTVLDNTISWQAVTREISDPNCPHSRTVMILAMKVFAGDDDIVRYCATLNAKDWTSEKDAGFLATGMQGANCNGVTALNQYRGDLAFFNPQVFQNWLADPDPTAMAAVDLIPGIGSSYQTGAQAVGDDLYYLTARGIRSLTISAGGENLSAGDIGEPIDPLCKQLMVALDTFGTNLASAYYPGRGQYLFAVRGYPTLNQTTVLVLTKRKKGGGWSRYVYDFQVESFAQLGDDLYMLAYYPGGGVGVLKMEDGYNFDDVLESPAPTIFDTTAFPGRVAWPFLDNGVPGVTKELEAIDYVGEGQAPSISIAFDQRNPAYATDPYLIDNDTLPGCPIPIPVSAPTMSPVLDFAGGAAWRILTMNLYFYDSGDQP